MLLLAFASVVLLAAPVLGAAVLRAAVLGAAALEFEFDPNPNRAPSVVSAEAGVTPDTHKGAAHAAASIQ